METRRAGFWKDFSEKIVDMTRTSKKGRTMYAMWRLNKAIMDLYLTMSKPYSVKEFNHYAGYLLHSIVLVDSTKELCSALSYLQEDVLDSYDKGTLIRIANQISGLAMDHENVRGGSPPGHYGGDHMCSWQTEEQLIQALRRLLKFIMGETTLSLRDLATQHVAIYYGREPACE